MAKAQLTFEFLILLGGVLLIAVFIIGMLYFSVKNQNVCSAIQTQVSQLDTYKIVVTVPNPCEKYDNTNNITITGTVLISDEVKNNYSLKNWKGLRICIFSQSYGKTECHDYSTGIQCFVTGSGCNQSNSFFGGAMSIRTTGKGMFSFTINSSAKIGKYTIQMMQLDSGGVPRVVGYATPFEVTKHT